MKFMANTELGDAADTVQHRAKAAYEGTHYSGHLSQTEKPSTGNSSKNSVGRGKESGGRDLS